MCDAKVVADCDGDLTKANPDVSAVGVALFMRMFKNRPETQDKFPNYKGKSIDALKSDPVLKAHAGKVVGQLATMVKSANGAAMGKIVTDFKALHQEKAIPHAMIAGTKGDIIDTLAEFGMSSPSWGPFLDYVFNAVQY